MSQIVAYFDSPLFDHHFSIGHPERPERLFSIRQELKDQGIDKKLKSVEVMPISEEILHLIYHPTYIKKLEQASLRYDKQSRLYTEWIDEFNQPWNDESFGNEEKSELLFSGLIAEDTYLSQGSFAAALYAAGAAVQAAFGVIDGHFNRAFCAVRPPGHHATASKAMGFCLLNNVALAAEAALQQPGITKVAILDWDLHHGNGTQEIFWRRNDVFYASTHQSPLYPGTGFANEIGEGEGAGFTINCPLPQGSKDSDLLEAWEKRICPRFTEYAPDLLLISAGFDADHRDPLSGLDITQAGLTELSARVVNWADKHCAGRLVSVLEGGYNLQALAKDVAAHIDTLTNQ